MAKLKIFLLFYCYWSIIYITLTSLFIKLVLWTISASCSQNCRRSAARLLEPLIRIIGCTCRLTAVPMFCVRTCAKASRRRTGLFFVFVSRLDSH